MKIRVLVALLLLGLPYFAEAHLGSPDIFFAGNVGPYPARITIRMPVVVPGRAEISVRVESAEPVTVSFLPLYYWTAVSNAPPPDTGQLIRGETNLYTGQLWLMTSGAYGIQINVRGAAGEGIVELPVNSVPIRQLPMPRILGWLLAALGLLLVLGAIAIVMAAARDSVLDPGMAPARRQRTKGWIAGTVMLLILSAALFYGRRWWNSEEKDFRSEIPTRPGPDLAATVRAEGGQRILEFTLGKKTDKSGPPRAMLPDHGKLVHLFMVREGADGAFAHLHPIRKGGKAFEVALPPLPEGQYKMFCDFAFENNGMSYTSTNTVFVPAMPGTAANTATNAARLDPDADDSWAVYTPANVPSAAGTNAVYKFPDGDSVLWKNHPPLRVREDAGLEFEIRDADGQPVPLESYLGMMSHAAVMRRDETIFSHLHPSGNFSMAAMGYFQGKLSRENPAVAGLICGPGAEHAALAGSPAAAKNGASIISLPYEFPAPGDYRIWLQFKTGGQVRTAVFDATVKGS